MKYFSKETVVKAYQGFQDCMTNKSWGYLALLKGCKQSICPYIPYEVNMDIVSNFLESIFNFSSTKRKYNGGRSLYVVFSNRWDKYFNYQGKYSPNIYDVIVWAYRRKAFPDNITNEELIQQFFREFNIPSSVITDCFDTRTKDLTFEDTLYLESDLTKELNGIGVNISSNNIDAKKASVVASPGEISRGPFVQTLYAGLDITDYIIILQSDYNSLYNKKGEVPKKNGETCQPLQQIFYGAPGTGKSNTIKREVDDKGKENFRTTFHPDSDYSTFVGAYKPTMDSPEREYSLEELVALLKETKLTGTTYPCHKFAAKYWKSLKNLSAEQIKQLLQACGFTDSMNVEISKGIAIGEEILYKSKEEKIVYRFTPQAFTKAYTAAWNTEDDVYLIIEEINRGNCAQIFGDLFQLLDRKEDGFSEYPIDADTDLAKHLEKELAKSTRTDFPEGVKEGKKLVLPNNLYIWATMNTSDQSLFPIDSAFKRRWDWKYIPIKEADEKWSIVAKGMKYDWWTFVERMNSVVGDATSSEDKKMGFFFCKSKNKEIDANTFVSKVVFYLWNDVFKDNGLEWTYDGNSVFKYKDENDKDVEMTFSSFFNADGTGNEEQVIRLMKNLKIEGFPVNEDEGDEDYDEQEELKEDIAEAEGKSSKMRLTIEFPDGTVIDGATKFDSYFQALSKIGLKRAYEVASRMKYHRLHHPLIDMSEQEEIISAPEYSYVNSGEYYIIKGINGKTMRNILHHISEELDLHLNIFYR